MLDYSITEGRLFVIDINILMQLLSLEAMSRVISNVSSIDDKKDRMQFGILFAQAINAAEKINNVLNHGITPQKPVNNVIPHQVMTVDYMVSKNPPPPVERERQADNTEFIAYSEPTQEELPPHKKYDILIAAAAEKYEIDPALLKGLIKAESNFNKTARSREGALGLVQLMPSTARSMGVNPLDPKEAIEGGAKYLSQMLNRYDGNTEMALAAYNAGPGNVDRYRGIPPFRETVLYIKRVTQNATDYSDDFKCPVT